MRKIANSDLAEALAHWGSHEASGRFKGKNQIDPTNKLASIDFILKRRAPFVSRLIAREPIETIIVDFEPSDIESIVLADGTTIKSWIENVRMSGGESLEYLDDLVSGKSPIEGKLVSAARLINIDSAELSMIVLYDGWHRVASWVERSASGNMSTIQSFLTITNLEDPLFQI